MNYFEILPDGQIFATTPIRTIEEVIDERMVVAKFFLDSAENEVELLQTGCGLMHLSDKTINKMPVSIQLQNKITIDNKVKARELINWYLDDLLERKWSSIVQGKEQKPPKL